MSLVFIRSEEEPVVYGELITNDILVLIPEKEHLFDGVMPSIQTSSIQKAIDIVKTSKLVHYRDCDMLTLHELGILYSPSVPQEKRGKHTVQSILEALKEIQIKILGD